MLCSRTFFRRGEIIVTVTRKCAEYISSLKYEMIPNTVIDQAKKLILDTIGCTLGGSQTETVSIFLDYLLKGNKNPESTVIGHNLKISCQDSVFINAQMGHILDYDETYKNIAHPAATTLFPALSIGEIKQKSGKDLLVAFIVGYDLAARIAAAMLPSRKRRERVWPFGTFHIFGAVSSASKMLSLSTEQNIHALGIAGATAPVPSTRRYMDKPCMIKNCNGWVARAGLDAAYLAANGLTGLDNILDGDTGFWIMAGSDNCNYSLLQQNLGEEFEVINSSIKPYPSCKWTHSTLEAFDQLKKQKNLQLDNIQKCICRSNSYVCDYMASDTSIETMEDAWTSIRWGIAMLCLGVPRGPAWFNKEYFNNNQVLDIMKRVELQPDPAVDKEFPEKLISTVEVITVQGDKHISRVEIPKGDPERPLSWNDICQKFNEMVSPIIGSNHSKTVINIIRNLEEQTDLSILLGFLKKLK